MASTYSPSLRLELMATGDQSGTWGDTTNTNLGTLLEQAITGYLSKAMADTNQTLTNLNGASDEARNMVVEATGALTAGRNIVVPTAEKLYLIKNSTTGGFAVTVKTSAGTGVAVYSGQTRWVFCDGTNVVDGSNPKFIDSQFLLADDADVTKLAAFQLSGLTTGTTRTLTVPDASGEIALLTADLAALEALSSTGLAVRSGLNTWVLRGISGTASQITVTNGNGVSGDPTVSLPTGLVLPGTATVTGGSVIFPATQVPSSDANALDDYEEGQTTPTPSYSSGSSVNVSAILQYTKIGRCVNFVARVTMVDIGTAAGTVTIALPFTANSQGGSGGGLRSGSGGQAVSGEIGASSSNLNLRLYDANTALLNGATLLVSGSYNV